MTHQHCAQWRSSLGCLIGVLVLLGLLAPSALAATAQCGETLTSSITLTNNLTNCPGDGLDIGHDNIIVNLNGHSISGPGIQTVLNGGLFQYIGINFQGHSHVTVIGGPGSTIENFSIGLSIDGNDNTVQQVATSLIPFDAIYVTGTGNTVTNSSQTYNPASVPATCPSSYCVGNGIILSNNGPDGGGGNTVSHDTSTGNGVGVGIGTSNNTVTRSTFTNDGTGIQISEDYSCCSPNSLTNNVITYNALTRDATGLADGSGENSLIAANIESGGAIGFAFGTGCGGGSSQNCTGPEAVTNNQAVNNKQYGFEAAPNVAVTFTGNRAGANTNAGFYVLDSSPNLIDNIAGSPTCTSGYGGGNGIGIELTSIFQGTQLEYAVSSGTIRGNLACNNKGGPDGVGGILMQAISNTFVDPGLSGNAVTGNKAFYNAGNGITDDFDPGLAGGLTPDTLTGNVAEHNYEDGIDVITTAIDGGGNIAGYNDDNQCVNIKCT